jgi:hypothetical protein
MPEKPSDNFQIAEKIFKVIRDYHQLNLSHFLRAILLDKGVSIIELYQKLQAKGFYLNRESLYRYFNPSQKSNRFPSQDFIKAFSEVLQLTDEQSELLLKFWIYWRIIKKWNFCR